VTEATRWTGRPSSPHSRILYALAEPVEACRIRTVAMESTGVYRIPLFQILEERRYIWSTRIR
jgi:hypothetical protein